MGDPTPTSAARPLRVLVAENHSDTLRYLRIYLEGLGPAGRRRLGTVRRVQGRLPRPIYAVAMSGFALGADLEQSRAAGYRHHLRKPFDPSELDRVLREAAAGR